MDTQQPIVKINFKIQKIEELSYTHKAFELLQKFHSIPESFEVATTVTYNWNIEANAIGVVLGFKYFVRSGAGDTEPFEALEYITSTNFEIKDLADLLQVRSPIDFDINRTLETTLVSIAISTTRGMLFVRTMGTVFHDQLIPILNPQELLLSVLLKKQKGSA